jgi:hypothetical protein
MLQEHGAILFSPGCGRQSFLGERWVFAAYPLLDWRWRGREGSSGHAVYFPIPAVSATEQHLMKRRIPFREEGHVIAESDVMQAWRPALLSL